MANLLDIAKDLVARTPEGKRAAAAVRACEDWKSKPEVRARYGNFADYHDAILEGKVDAEEALMEDLKAAAAAFFRPNKTGCEAVRRHFQTEDRLIEYLAAGKTAEKIKALGEWTNFIYPRKDPSLYDLYGSAVGVYLADVVPEAATSAPSSAGEASTLPRSREDKKLAAVAEYKKAHPEASDRDALLGAAREDPDLFRKP